MGDGEIGKNIHPCTQLNLGQNSFGQYLASTLGLRLNPCRTHQSPFFFYMEYWSYGRDFEIIWEFWILFPMWTQCNVDSVLQLFSYQTSMVELHSGLLDLSQKMQWPAVSSFNVAAPTFVLQLSYLITSVGQYLHSIITTVHWVRYP